MDAEVLLSMLIDCADDLGRWARAFAQQDDPMTVEWLRSIQQRVLDRARDTQAEITAAKVIPKV